MKELLGLWETKPQQKNFVRHKVASPHQKLSNSQKHNVEEKSY